MAVHTIVMPDVVRGEQPRRIVWDDEAGTVEGNHFDVPSIQRIIDAPKPVEVGGPGWVWSLRDPGHDPAEFLVILCVLYWPIETEPLRSTLPPIFDGVGVPEGERGEYLYDGNGDLMV